MVLLLIALLIASIGIWYYVNNAKSEDTINVNPPAPGTGTPVVEEITPQPPATDDAVGRSGTDQES